MYDDLLTEYKRKQYCPYIHHIKNSRILSHKYLNYFYYVYCFLTLVFFCGKASDLGIFVIICTYLFILNVVLYYYDFVKIIIIV